MNAQATASDAPVSSTPKNMWEFGVHLGSYWMSGDVAGKFGYGGGLHLRKALDHAFSVRGEVFYGVANGENAGGAYSTIYSGAGYPANTLTNKFNFTNISGAAHVVFALNNLRLSGVAKRKWSPYVFAGPAAAFVKTLNEIKKPDGTIVKDVELTLTGLDYDNFVFMLEGGAGLAYNVSDKFNIALEYKGSSVFGKRADYLDGYDYRWRDFLNLLNVRLNFNLGKTTNRSIPLWWVNPGTDINNDLAELKARPKLDLTDTDGDGIIDMLDQEKETPKGAPVDTRGIALDSDGDKLADYMDNEPYSPVGFPVDAKGVAQVPKPNYTTEADVNKIVDGKLAASNASRPTGAGLADWFLPIIHFDFDKSNIKTMEYEKLRQVANVMKNNPNIRVAVTGHTDKKASDNYNQGLSYRRAQNAIDYLISNYGISRDRLVLTYSSENDVLVKTNEKNYMNRRVEFKVATSESEMGQPSNAAPRPRYKGNKSSGY